MDDHPPVSADVILRDIADARKIKQEEGKSKRWKRMWSLAMARLEYYLLCIDRFTGSGDTRTAYDTEADLEYEMPTVQMGNRMAGRVASETMKSRAIRATAQGMKVVPGLSSCHASGEGLMFTFEDGTVLGVTFTQSMGDPPSRRDEA